jgi:N-acylneuraminate cytidylyltransferase
MVVLSTEVNSVVGARCRKLGLPCEQALTDKSIALRRIAEQRGVELARTIFIGNDVNDLACLKAVGCSVVPADAHPDVREHADIVLESVGGQGAVRELCDSILAHLSRKTTP